MDKKIILQDFVESLNEMLSVWTNAAGKFHMSSSAENRVIPMEFYKIIRYINERLDWFRKELKIQYDYYQELEDKYELKPLSLAYLEQFSVLTKDLSHNVTEIKNIGKKYDTILEKCEQYGMDINKYVSRKNRKYPIPFAGLN